MNVPYAVAAPAVLGELRRLLPVVEQLDDRALLARSRCFGWTRGDVLTHVHLALQDMLLGLVDPTDAEPGHRRGELLARRAAVQRPRQ